MSNSIVKNASDFLFLYEAIQCNPNGDPDQENKPRMDYDTKTNLVTDTRVKRFIRDYLMDVNEDELVFVNMEDNQKVSVDSKLKAVVKRTMDNEGELEKAFKGEPEKLEVYKEILHKSKDLEEVWKSITDKKFKHKDLNYILLDYLVKQKYIDVRMFGSAFAVGGFTKAYTGPIQMNWGYSLNKVELMESSSIVTIMNDDNSTFGKDYRLHYSLLGFNGTINQHAAKVTGLTEEDVNQFSEALWKAIPANPTRSKLNQYPKLYVKVTYKEGESNGNLGDLRNYVSVKPKAGISEKQIRKFSDLELDTGKLKSVLEANKDIIEKVEVKTAPDVSFSVNL